MSIGSKATVNMQQGKVKFEAPMSSRGKVNVGASGKASFGTNSTAGGRRRLLEMGQHVSQRILYPARNFCPLTLDLSSTLDKPLCVHSSYRLPHMYWSDLQASVQVAAGEGIVVHQGGIVEVVSASLSVLKLDSAGEIILGKSASGRRLLDSRRRLESGNSDIAIGEGGLNSKGLITVPAGATFTFNTNNKATCTIAGKGMDNNGKVSIVSGDVTVAAGGIRSSSSTSEVALSGGKLDFASTAPSVIGGKGISIGAAASVVVSKGSVGFSAKITGKVTVKDSAKVVLSSASGIKCGGGAIVGSGCTDNVDKVTCSSLGGCASPTKSSGVGHSEPAALLLGLAAVLVMFTAN